MTRAKIQIGEGFRSGRLTAVRKGFDRKTKGGSILHYWVCECDCGNMKTVLDKHLRSGKINSCGCLRREVSARTCTTHGGSKTQEWAIFNSMHARCSRAHDPRYKDYGGRGIKVCDKWHDFTLFIADVGPRPSALHSIDRINNDGNYEPGNVRWATSAEQQNNKRSNVRVPLNGALVSLKQYCQQTGLSYHTAQYRKNVLHWPITRVLELSDGRR